MQLAKAAVAAGIETLLETAGVAAQDIRTLYIAGGFGTTETAQRRRHRPEPRSLAPKAHVLGNGRLEGACRPALDEASNKQRTPSPRRRTVAAVRQPAVRRKIYQAYEL